MIILTVILSIALAISIFFNFVFYRYVKAFKTVVEEYKKQKRKAEILWGLGLTMTVLNFIFLHKLNKQ